jgi:hypothetical protein
MRSRFAAPLLHWGVDRVIAVYDRRGERRAQRNLALVQIGVVSGVSSGF